MGVVSESFSDDWAGLSFSKDLYKSLTKILEGPEEQDDTQCRILFR